VSEHNFFERKHTKLLKLNREQNLLSVPAPSFLRQIRKGIFITLSCKLFSRDNESKRINFYFILLWSTKMFCSICRTFF